ncbi:nicotinate-nucleotide--dimethylbenzimidazole phosphoribosyltransferase [Luteibacter aegosomatis]|uniref:nicotinate-nucleotide--dimethylbenzimidazole phosphoribosyltransferase n=1 Tax=Luteibacter aegosomatis TaxID=2911537 RepID=UPI001FF8051F|nr:nicotinate-nucleotide--dimethylbenzimidazole phosphoribosyltransferase [Luteibacter aegosomatis]UPG86149.1 nicotinate-nucleotide--dimethylbenzimidazole phosphoribosyltransferase [Luteibacter aegosomatis]
MTSWMTDPCRFPDTATARSASQRQTTLTKPPGSLGRLEEVAILLASLQGREWPRVDRVHIAVFAGDHGLAADGVSAFPQVVTGEMVRNFATGGAAIAVLASELGATLDVVNLGTVNDPGDIPGVRREIIAPSTANIRHDDAMSDAQLEAALEAGRHSVERAIADGAELYIGGEMGIGNTAVASALACALLGRTPDALTGAGTGLDDAGVARKAAIVAEVLRFHEHALSLPREALRRVGGFEIAALVGAFTAAAQRGLPVLVDGFIASVAALVAVAMQSDVRAWLIFAHRSRERGHDVVLDALHAEPLLDLHMRLGEASGAAVAVPLLRMACALHGSMATFAEAGVSQG